MNLFKRIVGLTGLSPLLAPGTVRRALASVGATDPTAATADDFLRALPQIERRLKVYLPEAEAQERVELIRTQLADG